MTGRVVVAADLAAGLWNCEGCQRLFKVGDIATSIFISGEWGLDPYGLNSLSMGGAVSDYDMSSGHVASKFLCVTCLDAL